MAEVKVVGGLGCGLMGSGIAQVAAQAGYRTIVREVTDTLNERGKAGITKSLDKFVEKGKLATADRDAVLGRLTVTTSKATFERTFAFAKTLAKEPVAAKDNSGFLVNLLLVPYLLGAVRALEHGVGSVPDMDKAMVLGCGYPMGPFTLLDFVGLDTTWKIAEIMFDEYREPQYAPPPLLRRMVLSGMYGKKSGRGFYDYSTNPPAVADLGL